jgi:hypothetical protein
MRKLLVIPGFVPAKKNLWRHGKGKQMYFAKDGVGAQIEALTWECKRAWVPNPPAMLPKMWFVFYCKDLMSDIDNKLTTLLDILKVAGVIHNDNLKFLPGPITIRGEVDAANERTEITLEYEL